MRLIYKIALIATALFALALPAVVFAVPYSTFVGGTGTTTPSGILYGDNTAGDALETLIIGTNLTLSGNTLNASGGGGNSFAYPFTITSYGGATTTNTGFLGGLISNGSTTISSLSTGLVGDNGGLLYSLASSSLFGFTPLNPTRNVNTTYPLQGGGNLTADLTLSTALSTTTQNFWNAYNNFSSLFATNASSTNATTTNLAITGANASNCNGTSALTTNSSGVVGCTAQPQGTVTAITAAFPLASTGGATPNVTSAYSTTTNTGLSQGLRYIGSGGIDQIAASSSIFGYTPLNPTRNINTTFPLQGGGNLSSDLTLSSALSTTSNSGMAQGNLYIGSGGIFQTGASSTLFGFTPASSALTVTLSGTANQITSSNSAAQSLSGNVSSTFSLANHVIVPGDILIPNSTTTNATTTGTQYITSLSQVPLYVDNTGLVKSGGSGTSGHCVQWGANNTFGDAGGACGTAGGITALGSGWASTTNTTITFSTTTATVNGLTYGMTIVPAAGSLTFTPTVTGTYSGQAGSVANSLSHDSTLNGTSFNGSSAVSNWGINLTNGNTWTALQQLNGNASTTQLDVYKNLNVGPSATTTIAGNATSTFGGGINLSNGGCFAIGTVCIGAPGTFVTGTSLPVNYASTTTLPAYTYTAGVITAAGNGAFYIDGNNPTVGQRVLIKNESGTCTSSSGACNNGIYTVTAAGSGIAAFVLTRASDYNSSTNVYPGIATYVVSGATLNDDWWAMTSAAPITVGTTGLVYTETSSGITQAIQSLGAAGQLQTGSTQTFSTSTSAFNGLTPNLVITSSNNTQTFTSSLSGTLNSAGLTATGVSGSSCTNCNLSYNAQGQLTSASNGSAGSGSAYSFTPGTFGSTNTSGTTTALSDTIGIFASSTTGVPSWIDQLNIGSTTASTEATSTDFGNFSVRGNASSTQISDSGLTTGLVLNTTGSPFSAYAGTNPCSANQALVSLNASGAGSCSSTFLTGNQSITLTGAVTGSGATSIATTFGNLSQGWFGVIGASAATPIANATTTLFSGTTGQVGYFSASGALVGTSSLNIATSQSVGIGTTTPVDTLDIFGSKVNLINNGGVQLDVTKYASSAAGDSIIQNRGRGTETSPSALQAGDTIGNNTFSGYDGSNFTQSSNISALVDSNGSVSAGVVPGLLTFSTANTSGTVTEAFRTNAYQYVGIGTTSPYAKLSIQANPTDSLLAPTLFAIGSSTASATTTLFSVSPPSGSSDLLDIFTLTGTTPVFAISNIGSTTLGMFGTCSGSNALTTNSSGIIVCGAITGTAGGSAYPFTPQAFGTLTTSATTSAILDNTGIIAATSTFATIDATSSITDNGLTNGNCVQAGTNGLLTTTGSACGSGGGAAFPFTQTTYNGINVNATSTGIWLKSTSPFSLIASSTFANFASTTNFEMTLYADDFPGSDIGAQINNAYASLPSTGGEIFVPSGAYSFSTQINFNTNSKPVLLQCGSPGLATELTWTGGQSTSTVFNNGATGTIFQGNGIDGCSFTANGQLAGIQVGGSNGAAGIVINKVTINNFKDGITFGSNTWNVSVTNSLFQNNKQNLLIYASNNSGERMDFTNDVFADSTTTQDGVYLTPNAVASALFSGDSFDDNGVGIGGGNTAVSFVGSHFENPAWNSIAVYNYVEASSSQGADVSFHGGFFLNDATTAAKTPTQFVLNSGTTMSFFGVGIESNNNSPTAELPSVVNNQGSNASVQSYGTQNVGTNSFIAFATSSLDFGLDTFGGTFQTGLISAALPFNKLFTLSTGDPITNLNTGPSTAAYAINVQNPNSVNASSTGIAFESSAGDPTQGTGVVGADMIFQRVGSGSYGNLLFETSASNNLLENRFILDNLGHVGFGIEAVQPTVGTCGTSPSITGDDTSGTVTVGTGATVACTVSFGAAYTNVPRVFVQLESAIATTSVLDTAPAVGSFIFRSNSGMGGAKVDYWVMGSTTLPKVLGSPEPSL